MMVNFAFSHVMSVLKEASDSMVIWLSGSLRTISRKIFASRAMMPLSTMSPSMMVSIPMSMSLAVRVMMPLEASMRMHSRIDMVVLLGTALDTICTPLSRLDLVHTIFIWITPFPAFRIFLMREPIYIYKEFHSLNSNGC